MKEWSANNLVKNINEANKEEMQEVAESVLKSTYLNMLDKRIFEDKIPSGLVLSYCKSNYNEQDLISIVINTFTNAGYVIVFDNETNSFNVSVKALVEYMKGDNDEHSL